MAKIGRNDPCPCGSGKKYKYCCLRKERAEQYQRVTTHRGDQQLLGQLLQFALGEAFQVDFASAAQLYWDTSYAPRLMRFLSPSDTSHFLEWYVTDYRTSHDRKRIPEVFLEKYEDRLNSDEIQRLRFLINSRLRLYRVQETRTEKLKLLDLLRDVTLQVNGEQWAEIASLDDVIVGRILGAPEYPYLSPRAILLPPDAADKLRNHMQEQFEIYNAEHLDATLDDFLLNAGYLFIHFLMSEEAETWQDKIGVGTPYYDARKVRLQLERLEERLREEDQQQLKESKEEGPTSPKGILTPEQVWRSALAKEEVEREPVTTPSGLVLPDSMRPKESQEEEEGPKLYIPGRDF